jgi:hypothetical protein
MAHVAHSRLVCRLRPLGCKLALNDLVGDVGCLKQGNGEGRVEAPIHRAVEDLLDDVVDNIMEEVVPRIGEEE